MRSLLLLAHLCACALLAASVVSARPTPRAQSRLPDVDGWDLTRQDADWFSVCQSSSPVSPSSFPAPASILPMPVIDADTNNVDLAIVAGRDETCLAWGFHSDDVETVGWSYLSVETNAGASDYLQSRAAGYLEGFLSQERIKQNVDILLPGFYATGKPSTGVLDWLNRTLVFKQDMIEQVGGIDPYWTQIACLYLQVQGMFEGYSAAVTSAEDALSWFDIYSLQLDVDISDITTAVGLFSPLATDAERTHAAAAVEARRHRNGLLETHCSALVKLLPGNTELFVGHDTWSGFRTMLRTFKLYNLPLRVSLGSSTVHMSSYPGFLFSSDDWYQLEPSLLTVTETSLSLYNPALYAAVQPGTVGIWARTIVANRLAVDGPSWVEAFSRYNSGTCDNQWIIVDHKLFTAGDADLKPNLLTISEQMPGFFVTRDMTPHLAREGYWSSFNIPAFNLSYIVSGYDTCTGGPYVCSYFENFRYILFASLVSSVTDLDSMQQVLMYNEWETNALQRNSSAFGIAARYDLAPAPTTAAFGGIDGKITSDSWMKAGALRVSAYSGPTTETQEPFCWGGQFVQPVGQPRCFDFPWVQYSTDAADEETSRIVTE